MRCPRLPAIAAAALALLPGPVAASPAENGPSWKSRIEFISQYLSTDQSRVVRDHAVSLATGAASITFTYDDGGRLVLALENGDLRVDGRSVGRVPVGGALEAAWLSLMLEASRSNSAAILQRFRNWEPTGLSREESAFAQLLREQVDGLSAPPALAPPPQAVAPAQPGGLTINLSDLSNPAHLAPLLRSAASLRGDALRITIPGGQAHLGHFSIGSAERYAGHLLVVRGDAEIFGRVEGNLASVEGNVLVHPGAVITGDVLAVAGEVRDLGGDILGQIRTLDAPREAPGRPAAVPPPSGWMRAARNGAGVAGVFLTLMLVGTGLVLFGRPPLEVVSDTVIHSFSRSLLVGVLGQVLLLPTFGMLVVGLILTVAGVLLVPFAVVVFALLLVVAVLGGFLAVAHAMGEKLTRRQLALGQAVSANSYRYVTMGLAGVMALWLAWVAFDWVPVAGTVIFATAALVTWLLGTVGFGAALLSRGGLREHFAGRFISAESLTDEYLWATPQFGVTAVKRPPRDGRTPPPL
ncbi:MAG: polymer-forming cytoskeletal protein [Gemmatimonadetes bacterium]|nr:polymer-forming cytoskeletal protein [Gemmatimonadota bacterium]